MLQFVLNQIISHSIIFLRVFLLCIRINIHVWSKLELNFPVLIWSWILVCSRCLYYSSSPLPTFPSSCSFSAHLPSPPISSLPNPLLFPPPLSSSSLSLLFPPLLSPLLPSSSLFSLPSSPLPSISLPLLSFPSLPLLPCLYFYSPSQFLPSPGNIFFLMANSILHTQSDVNLVISS